MQQTYLYELVQSFSKRERREARKWLASPYHNQRGDLQQLFDLLVREAPAPPKRRAWQILFPSQPYDDQQFRLLLSYL